MFESVLNQLEIDLHAALGTGVAGLMTTVRACVEDAHADIVKEKQCRGLA
jgi:hypothetical protein